MREEQLPPNQQQLKDEQQRQEQQYDTFLYKFQQQIIDAWKPVPYTKNNIILYSILTVICVTLGLVLILTAPNSQQIEQRYDSICEENKCQLQIRLQEQLQQPVYLYYGLNSYYQNHRRYLKFFSIDQMNGGQIDEATARLQCGDELFNNEQIGATKNFAGQDLQPDAVAHPCGARAKSYLKIKSEIKSMKLKYQNGTQIEANRENIAWPADPQIYINSGNTSMQAINNEDKDWLVWYRPAARNFFFKLHSVFENNLPKGTYIFETDNSFDHESVGAEKWIHLGKSNYVGNKDLFLGIAFLSLGGGCLIVLVIFIAKCVTQRRQRPKNQ